MASDRMRAIVVDSTVKGRLAIREVPVPQPAAQQALIRVAAVSLNRGEVRNAVTEAQDGARIGWDLAGVVERPAADGSGPKAGTRVVGLDPIGGWAEYAAVLTLTLAPISDAVSFADAATLPVAGLTARHALLKGGELRGQRVLVNGASGGVGTFACQLAHLAGAHVVAAIRDGKQESFVRGLGADAVAIGPSLSVAESQGPYHLIVESVGGSALGAALGMLAPGGTCVLLGTSESARTTFDADKFYHAGGTTLYGLALAYEFQRELPSVGLAHLAQLVAEGKLKPAIEVTAPWTEIADIAAGLMDRRYSGKAVLTL
ncbi:MAG: zinc-binding dehydrogenase [Candidatus Binataceae bacterium]